MLIFALFCRFFYFVHSSELCGLDVWRQLFTSKSQMWLKTYNRHQLDIKNKYRDKKRTQIGKEKNNFHSLPPQASRSERKLFVQSYKHSTYVAEWKAWTRSIWISIIIIKRPHSNKKNSKLDDKTKFNAFLCESIPILLWVFFFCFTEFHLENGKTQSATTKDQIRSNYGTTIFVGMNKTFNSIMNDYLKQFWANVCPFTNLNITTNKTRALSNYGWNM